MEANRREPPEGRKGLVDLIGRQGWLDQVAESVQPEITELFKTAGPAGQKVKDLLNGVWLGHPLHPVLTDIPLGAWTAAVLLDAMEANGGRNARGLARAADAAVGLGLAGALGAAMTGLTDWSDTAGRPRKIGVAHGILNLGATLLLTTSLFCRRRRNRGAGRLLGLLGYLVSLGAAYLGGHLVYGEQVGVDHTAAQEPPEGFVSVLPEAELPEDRPTRVLAGNVPVLLVRRHGRILAISETCAHAGGPLSEGKLEGDTIVCPWHASRYSLETGEIVNGPSTFPQPCWDTRVVNGRIEVRAAGR